MLSNACSGSVSRMRNRSSTARRIGSRSVPSHPNRSRVVSSCSPPSPTNLHHSTGVSRACGHRCVHRCAWAAEAHVMVNSVLVGFGGARRASQRSPEGRRPSRRGRGRRSRWSFRGGRTSRYGGDEVVVVLADGADAPGLIARLRQRWSHHLCGVSAGIAVRGHESRPTTHSPVPIQPPTNTEVRLPHRDVDSSVPIKVQVVGSGRRKNRSGDGGLGQEQNRRESHQLASLSTVESP